MYKLGWFSTGRGEGSRGLLRAIHDAIKTGEVNADIEFVFCSRERGETDATDIFLDMVTDYHFPLVSLSYRKFKSERPDTDEQGKLAPWRIDYDREVMKRLRGFQPDLCVLAGYMLIVGPEMCLNYNMINLHPAAPGGPKGTFQQVIWQLIENGAERTGVMMHLVTPELDEGPPVTYCTFPIRGKLFDTLWREMGKYSVEEVKKTQGQHNELFRAIRRHGYARELPLIIETIRAFSEARVRVTPDKKVVNADGRPIKGYDLTAEVDQIVQGTLPD